MNAFSIVSVLATLLELSVPSYALRLVRRFGAQQVGSFVIIAFASLALLHLVNPLKPTLNSNFALSILYGGASVLLLIGMGHTETVCRQRQQARADEQNLRLQLDAEAKERAENLLQVKQEMAQEIVRLQQQVETLTASERQYRFLFTQHPHPMWMFDLRTGRILTGNQAALNQYGFSQQEFTRLSAKDLLAREATQTFLADAAKPCSSLEKRGVWHHRRKDRTVLQVEIMAFDLRFGDSPARLIFAQDLGPRADREAELCDHERTRTLRRVAEGVAHHFGRILTVVEGQVPLLCEWGEEEPENEHLQQVLAETRRGNALLRQLLAVAGCESIQPEAIDLNAFVHKEEALLRRLMGDSIALEFRPGENLLPARVDGRVLEHVLVNLVLNARAALPRGGAIQICTDATWAEPRHGTPVPESVPGHYLRLAIRDNGTGMPPETQEHVFEPFFTTREDVKAMGLGLATVYGAIKQHGGWVEFVSEPQRGTEFSVYLPVAQLLSPAATQEAQLPPPTRETILLVESNDQVRDLARHILRRAGFRVIEADCPSTAALLMESQGEKIDLLLTDLRFPDGSSGADLAEQLRQFKSELEVVFATAPLTSEDHQPAWLEQAKLLLMPYTPDQLLQSVNLAVGNPAAA